MDKNIDDYISLAEYAKMHNRTLATVRQKVLRGGFKTARKVGRNWMINKNETETYREKLDSLQNGVHHSLTSGVTSTRSGSGSAFG